MMQFTFVGDVMLGRLINDYLASTGDFGGIWGNTKKTLSSADLTFVNLECALTYKTDLGIKESPVFFFRSQPDHVQALRQAGVDYCNLANNHILDYGIQGLLDTTKTLKEIGIFFSGAGENLAAARKPAEIVCGELRIKVFSLTDNEEGWASQKDKPGTFFLPIKTNGIGFEKFLNEIKKAKSEGCFVIVSAHWGPNMLRRPPRDHIDFAHALIEAGCDIIHGHSSHVFQAVEVYKNKIIFYDCGEMIDDYSVDPFLRNDESFIFTVYLKGEKIEKIILIPILIDSLKVNVARGDVGKKICFKMLELCKEFGTKAAFCDNQIEIQLPPCSKAY